MRVPKTEDFDDWALDEGVTDKQLLATIDEMGQGLLGDGLGSGLYKKRVPRQGRGKRGGTRTLIAYRQEDVAVFLFGYAKNERANITRKELTILRKVAKEMLSYSAQGWKRTLAVGTVIEVKDNAEEKK